MYRILRNLIFCVTLGILASPLAADPISDALKQGDAAAARAALEQQIAGRSDAALHRAHLEGLIAMRQGNYRLAADIFNAILTAVPTFEPARLQLVLVLDRLGQSRMAMTHARRLAATTDDENLRDQLITHIAQAEDGRPGGVFLRFSLLPSTNITGGTSARTVLIGGVPFTLDEPSREAAGVGLSFGITAYRKWQLGKDWRAQVSASADRRVYSTELKPGETEFGLRLDLTRRGKRSTLSFGPRMELLLQGSGVARRQIGLGLAGNYLIGPRHRLNFSAEWLKQDFPGAGYRDGTRTSASVGLQWAVSPKTLLSVDLPVLRETAAAPHLSHRDIGLGVGLEQTFDAGLTVGGALFVGRNRYDGVYPGFSVARTDDVASFRLSARHSAIIWNGMAPEFSVTRKRQSSTIPLHDTWTTDFGIAVTRRF